MQMYGTSHDNVQYQQTKQIYESDFLNPYQERLYKECLHGLGTYSAKELKAMPFQKKQAIISKKLECQKILNRWKQQKVANSMDNFLQKLFWHSPIINTLVSKTKDYANDSLLCYQSFRDLGISKLDIAKKLVMEGLLPKNFFTLNY